MVQTVQKVKRAHVLSPRRGRALRRRGEIERLISFRAEHRLPWVDPQGLADVWADTLFIATGAAPDLLTMERVVCIVGEAGCSAHQIMSITGHKTLSEVERYCREAGQKSLSKAAIVRLEEHSEDR